MFSRLKVENVNLICNKIYFFVIFYSILNLLKTTLKKLIEMKILGSRNRDETIYTYIGTSFYDLF